MLTTLCQRGLALLLPSTCFYCESDFCSSAHQADAGLCPSCRKRVRWKINIEYLQVELDALYATAEFTEAWREAILHFKYQRRQFLAADFALEWLRRTPYDSTDYDIVTAVPQTLLKQLTRGYNPAEEVASCLARQNNKPLVKVLKRRWNSTSQTDKSKSERFRNAELGFVHQENTSILRGKSVLLVDDVCTTGATLGVCARLLKRLGASRVLGAALARDMLKN